MATPAAKHVVQPVPPTAEDLAAAEVSERSEPSARITNHSDKAQSSEVLKDEKMSPSTADCASKMDSEGENNKVLVHMGYYCDGDDCARQWLLNPIVGARYQCVSCKNEKLNHNLCAQCYDKYSFKDDKLVGSTKTSESQPRQSDSISSIDVSCLFGDYMEQDDKSGQMLAYPRHAFRCISTPSEAKNGSVQLMDKKSKQDMDDRLNRFPIESKIAGYLEFDQLDFLFRGLLFYPFGMINHGLQTLFSSWISKKSNQLEEKMCLLTEEGTTPSFGFYDRTLAKCISYEAYFSKLPLLHIGCSLVWNALIVWYIVRYPVRYARDATLYWLYVYELFFARAVTAQVQLHMRDSKNGTFGAYAGAILLGGYYDNQIATYCLTWRQVHRYAMYRRHGSKNGLFVFPYVMGHVEYDDQHERKESEKQQCRVDPAKNLVKGPRKHVNSFTISKIVAIILALFLDIVLFTSVSSIDSSLLVQGIGTLMNLPNTTTYNTESIAIAPACHINSSSFEEEEMARAFVGLRLTPEPTIVRGLPYLTLQFYQSGNDTTIDDEAVDFTIDELWYATLEEMTINSVELQVLDKQNVIAAIISFPNLLCPNVSGINIVFKQTYSDLNKKLEYLRTPRIGNYQIVWFILFYFLISAPALLANTLQRVSSLYAIAMTTWDYWDAFNTYTSKSNIGGVWIVDRRALVPIDFSRVENCLAWFDLRKQLIEITSINLRFVFPLLCIALLEFVLSLAGICWYVVLGRAPVPGLLLLICLCTNPLPMLGVLFPLYKIWKIQYRHIAMISTKCFELNVMPPCADPNDEVERLKALRVLTEIKNVIMTSDERVSVMGFELSPGFLGTLATITFSGLSFLLGGKLDYYVREH